MGEGLGRIEDREGYSVYQAVDRYRLEEPMRVLELARAMIHEAESDVMSWILGSVAAAVRRLGHFQLAERLFNRAIELAKRFDDRESLNLLRHRLAHVYSDMGDFEAAIKQSHASLRSAVRHGENQTQGEAMLSLATWFYHQQDFAESIQCNLGALRLLPKSAVEARFSALLGNAYCCRDIGDLAASDEWADEANALRDLVSPAMLASLLMHRGYIAIRRGQNEVATTRFEAAYEFYLEHGFYAFAGSSAIGLCEAHLLCGRTQTANIIARSTARLIKNLSDSPYMQGVIGTLSGQALAGRPITLRFLADLRERLKEDEIQPSGSG